MIRLLFAGLVALCAVAPAVERTAGPRSGPAFPGWPRSHEGRALTPLPPAPEDEEMARQFPGRVARFSDGERQIVLRWVPSATRRLHPAAQCFRGAGYKVEPAAMRSSADGQASTCFAARKGRMRLVACERIHDDAGRSWPDVPAWYWSALLRPAPAGYWSVLEVRSD